MSDIIKQAHEKLEKELKDFKGDQKSKAVSLHVAKTLQKFCETEKFASTVVASEKTLSDCCMQITAGSGNYISDIEVYSKAAKFYFPDSKITFNMEISIEGQSAVIDEKDIAEIAKTAKAKDNVKTNNTKENELEDQEDIEDESGADEDYNDIPKAPKTPKVPKQPKEKQSEQNSLQISLFEL